MFYPRMITTAAAAWRAMGRTDFQSHVAVFERTNRLESIPTLMIKMSPWTPAELARVRDFLTAGGDDEDPIALVVNPLDPDASFLPPSFFSGDLPAAVVRSTPYRVVPATDDRPYFTAIRTTLGTARENRAAHVDRAHRRDPQHAAAAGDPTRVLPPDRHRDRVALLCGRVHSDSAAVDGCRPGALERPGPRHDLLRRARRRVHRDRAGPDPDFHEADRLPAVYLRRGHLHPAARRRSGQRRDPPGWKSPAERRWWWPFAAILVSGVALLLVA